VDRGLLRGRASDEQQVRPFELFFDLVFVLAVTQLPHRLLDHLTLGGAAQTLLLLLVVWQAWVTTTWVTNWFNPDQLPVRLMLVGIMLASLFMSAAIPDAFGDRGLMFAAAVAAIHVGRAAFAFIALRGSLGGHDPLTRTFQRALTWHVAAGVLWIAGEPAARLGPVPGMGVRSGHELRRPAHRLLGPRPGVLPNQGVGRARPPFRRVLPAVHHHRPG
jgi:low temperature requirement protein LtrA